MVVSRDCVVPLGRNAVKEEALLLDLYHEICASWRTLVDVRFRLAGLVPPISAAILIALLARKKGEEIDPWAGLIVSLFGLFAIFGVALYDQRNSQLHNELVDRGKRIESELGLAFAQFLGRPGSWRFVKHNFALLILYGATLLVWLLSAILFVVRMSTATC